MKRYTLSWMTGCWMLAAVLPASAQLSLSLQPSTSTVSLGGSTFVDIMVSGISTGMAPPIGLAAFAVELNYDAVQVLPTAVSYGTQLGTTIDFDTLAPTPLFVSSTSLEAAGFFASQPDSFRLATLTFQGLSLGTSALTFGLGTSLSDENGLSIPFSANGGRIEVVPEPGQIACMAVMLTATGGFTLFRRLRRQQSVAA